MNQDRQAIFRDAVRVIKYMRDCYLDRKDAESLLSAMTLERCLQAKTWHDSTTVLKQLRGIGVAYVRLLALKGIKTFDMLRQVEPEMLEVFCNRSTPFGRDLLRDLERIPRYELTVSKDSQVVCPYYSDWHTYRLHWIPKGRCDLRFVPKSDCWMRKLREEKRQFSGRDGQLSWQNQMG